MENIKTLRKFTGLSQPKVAQMVGLSRRPYQRYENMETKEMHCKIVSVLKKEIQNKSIKKIKGLESTLIENIEIKDNRFQICVEFKYFKIYNISDYIPKFIVQSKPLSSGNWSVKDFAKESKNIHDLCNVLNRTIHL